MAYKSWKLMDKIDVAIKTSPDKSSHGRIFDGYIVEHGDGYSLKKAKDWARERKYDREKRTYTTIYEPEVHTFDNEGFTAKIIESAGGSSQGGRLSFWACEIEKDGVKFTIGVNDEILADLVKNSDLSKGVVRQKVMFARKSGQPGLIHEGMESYQDALADMKHKAEMKSAKKTSKWELGGVYQSITQTDVCIGDVWDTMEEVEDPSSRGWYSRKILVKREKPVRVKAWLHVNQKNDVPITLTELLEESVRRNYVWFDAGRPPARAKTQQLEFKDSDLKLIDRLLEKDKRYLRELK